MSYGNDKKKDSNDFTDQKLEYKADRPRAPFSNRQKYYFCIIMPFMDNLQIINHEIEF